VCQQHAQHDRRSSSASQRHHCLSRFQTQQERRLRAALLKYAYQNSVSKFPCKPGAEIRKTKTRLSNLLWRLRTQTLTRSWGAFAAAARKPRRHDERAACACAALFPVNLHDTLSPLVCLHFLRVKLSALNSLLPDAVHLHGCATTSVLVRRSLCDPDWGMMSTCCDVCRCFVFQYNDRKISAEQAIALLGVPGDGCCGGTDYVMLTSAPQLALNVLGTP